MAVNKGYSFIVRITLLGNILYTISFFLRVIGFLLFWLAIIIEPLGTLLLKNFQTLPQVFLLFVFINTFFSYGYIYLGGLNGLSVLLYLKRRFSNDPAPYFSLAGKWAAIALIATELLYLWVIYHACNWYFIIEPSQRHSSGLK